MTKNLNKIIEDNQKDFHKDTFKSILKSWGSGFAKLPNNEKFDTLVKILKEVGIELAKDPAGGLAIKIAEQRRRDSDTQERIQFAQSWNLAVAMVAPNLEPSERDKSDKIQKGIESWQKYFYQQLKNQNNES